MFFMYGVSIYAYKINKADTLNPARIPSGTVGDMIEEMNAQLKSESLFSFFNIIIV